MQVSRIPSPGSATAEISRITREQVYQRQAFFVRSIGSVEPTAARRISLAETGTLVLTRCPEPAASIAPAAPAGLPAGQPPLAVAM